MCGIVGIINKNGEPGSTVIATHMSEKIAHRGPDGQGHWAKDNIAFGHRRLAIIDLSDAGSQPMQTADGRYSLCYNGEIYNHMDIRLEMKAKGVKFVSRCDTETVLNAIELWGLEAAVPKFNGMFSILCYDAKTRQMLVARDRYGVKPLYYCELNNVILFASEIKAFKGHPAFSMQMDDEGLVEYFTFQNFLGETTLFKHVKMFPQGHTSIIECGDNPTVVANQYWDFRFEPDGETADYEELKQELYFLFEQAVTRQMMSDVGVSSYLSGGMDSGSITAVAAQQAPYMRSFTCGFDLNSASGIELNFDERKLAEYMSWLFKTEHYEVVLKSGDMERAMAQLVWHLEEPRVGQSYPNYYVAGLASKFGKVVLGGAGGDELFGGYPWRYYGSAGAKNFEEFTDSYYQFWQRLVPESRHSQVFAPIWDSVKNTSCREKFANLLNQHPVDFGAPEAGLNLSLYFEAKTFLHGLLVVDDKLSMAHGLEGRVPFLDNDLVEFAMKIPAGARVRNLSEAVETNRRAAGLKSEAKHQFQKTNDGKLLLRDMMAKILPKDIVEAQKQGFSAPDASWFRGESIDFVKSNLLSKTAGIYNFLDHQIIEQELKLHFEGKKNNRLLIWSLLSVNQVIDGFGMNS